MMDGERAIDVTHAAEVAGVRITHDELSAIHRRDLILRPRVDHLGRGRGTESVYPQGTARQLIAYVELKRRFGDNHSRIGWGLWNLDFHVGEKYWQKPLQETADAIQYVARYAFESDESEGILSDKAVTAIEVVSKSRVKTAFVGKVRRCLRNRFSTLLRITLEVATGKYCVASQNKKEAEYRHFGLARLLGARSAGKKRKILLPPSRFVVRVDDFQEMLEAISFEFAKILRAKRLSAAAFESEIVIARNELNQLLMFFLNVESGELQRHGRTSPALAVLSTIARKMSVKQHSCLIVCWVVARRIPSVALGAQRLLSEISGRPSQSISCV